MKCVLSKESLLNALQNVQNIVTTRTTLPIFSYKESKLTMVATDGRRLALVEHELEFPKSSEADVILPSKAVQELQRILRAEDPLQITLSENQIAFDLGNIFLVSKLIEGNYP